nr:MAG TPA: hypothetical protein [Caudoviricetes sp.]
MMSCSLGCSITARRSCTSDRKRCGLCRSDSSSICGSATNSLWGLLNLSVKRILTRLCQWGYKLPLKNILFCGIINMDSF